MKNQRPSATAIRKSLMCGLFDPREPGPGLAFVIEQGDSSYFERRAIELISEARAVLKEPDLDPLKKKQYYHDKLNKVLSLIALAKVTQ